MRSEQALRNMIANLILQVTVFLSGIILPRFFLEAYGSSINGMVTSANQFLTYLSLAEAGVGSASVVALYIPLAENNKGEINAVLAATKQYYYKSGMLFTGMVIMLAWIYPYLIAQQLPTFVIRGVMLVLAGSTMIDFFLLGKYRVLLTANQKGYVASTIESIGTILNVVITIGLIYLRVNVIFVKSTGILIYLLRFLLTRWYVKKEYPELNLTVSPNFAALYQRGAALLHQIVGIIVNNTDVVLLTVLLGRNSLLEVSVYGIYNMVVSAINMLLNSFSNGLTAGFGEVISKQEDDVLKKSYSSYEYLYFIVLSIVCVCMGVLLLPFIAVYTVNTNDVNYIRPVIAILFTIIIFLQNVRIPALTMVSAAGHFKETQFQAVLEAVINLVVSITLIGKFGIAGVLIGTVCSYGYRSIAILDYNYRYLVKDGKGKTWPRLFRNFLVGIILIGFGVRIIPQQMDSFVIWFFYACGTGIVSLIVFLCVNFIFEKESFYDVYHRIYNIFKGK